MRLQSAGRLTYSIALCPILFGISPVRLGAAERACDHLPPKVQIYVQVRVFGQLQSGPADDFARKLGAKMDYFDFRPLRSNPRPQCSALIAYDLDSSNRFTAKVIGFTMSGADLNIGQLPSKTLDSDVATEGDVVGGIEAIKSQLDSDLNTRLDKVQIVLQHIPVTSRASFETYWQALFRPPVASAAMLPGTFEVAYDWDGTEDYHYFKGSGRQKQQDVEVVLNQYKAPSLSYTSIAVTLKQQYPAADFQTKPNWVYFLNPGYVAGRARPVGASVAGTQ